MAQGVLPFKYEEEKNPTGVTALGGLPIYLDLFFRLKLQDSIRRNLAVRAKGQGWSDLETVMALLLLNLAGGECVDDLRVLEADPGFTKVLRRVAMHGIPRRERRALERRQEKEGARSVPSPSSVFRYLREFHSEAEEARRKAHSAFIPAPNEHLRGLSDVNRDLVAGVQRCRPVEEATLDFDATLVETLKEEALHSYKGSKSYQPLNMYWAEHGLMLLSQFRDGNVPAGFGLLSVFKEALGILPDGVRKVSLRSDTAAYVVDLLRYCAEGKNERFGVIDFAIGVDVTTEFRAAVEAVPESEWKPLLRRVTDREGKERWEKTDQEFTEVCFVPNWAGHSKKNPDYRFLATRELVRQMEIPGMEGQLLFPFPTMLLPGKGRYKIHGVVTNRMDLPGDGVIWWYRERCGKSEEAHSVMKEDLAGGKMPSGLFGVNAAWWAIMVLAFNLNAAMKRLVLEKEWEPKRMKAVRFRLIRLPGLVLEHARQLLIRIAAGHPSLEILLGARRRILCLNPDGVG